MIPAWVTWAVYGAGGSALLGLAVLVAIGLCRSAADGDRTQVEPDPEPEPVRAAAHMCAYRSRRDVRNGLGGIRGDAA